MSGKGGRDPTTITLDRKTKARLDSRKIHASETYDELLNDLLDQLKGPPTEGPA